MLFWIKLVYEPNRSLIAFGLGISLALAIATKSSFQPLIFLFPSLFLFSQFWDNRHLSLANFKIVLIFITPCLFILLIFILHHKACCGQASITNPRLLEAALSHRVASNQMGIEKWMVGWIYYLPDFGDSLASKLFSEKYWAQLDSGPGSYYELGRDVIHAEVVQAANGALAVEYIVRNYILEDFGWHMSVSTLLLWRGLFVGKIWGLVAIVCSIVLLATERISTFSRGFLLLFIPLFAIAAVHSFVSVSIARYNMSLIMPFSLAIAWALLQIFALIQGKGQTPPCKRNR